LRSLHHENPLGLPRKGTPPQIPRMQRGLPQKRDIKNVKKVIAVSSAKGGVGKSTISVNLALAFAQKGLRSGVLDTDIFGPSIPTLLGISEEPMLTSSNLLVPLTSYGIKSMSMGYLVPKTSPITWRGLMVMKALQQLLHEVDWGILDVLVLDLPPGTGDVQLTITQQVNLAGALIVSTPQSLSVTDSVRGVNMFRKVDVPVLGMVQNMALYQCPCCGHEEHIFGKDGLKEVCEELDVRILTDIPLHRRFAGDADIGKPTVIADPGGEHAKVFSKLADEIALIAKL